jgi:hypothetical protein
VVHASGVGQTFDDKKVMNVHRGKVVESACGSHTEIPKFDCLIDAVYTPYHA